MAIPSQRTRNQRRLRRPSKVTRARWAAWLTIRRTFDEDAWTDRAFAGVVQQLELDDDPRERAFAQRLAYGTVQQAKRVDHVIATLGKRPLHKLDPPVLHALRLGCYELLELRAESAHAAVDQAVEIVRGVVGERAVAFTNAILRRAQVDGELILDALDPTKDSDIATLVSMPEWLVHRLRADMGDDAIAELRAMNEPHPAAFRDTTTGESIVVGGSTAHLADRIDRGELVPQSLASQLVVRTLDPQPGERVLDMCAAPGGKATHAAQLVGPDGALVAVELHEHRADSIRALATRVGVADRLCVVQADATTLTLDMLDETNPFDRVLLDAPCSGTGVLAARPDARWKRTEEGIDELVELQRRLLATAATLVRPGGVLVYSTCSILAAEDESIIEHLPPGLTVESVQRTWPSKGADGFFIARMRRDAEASA